MPPPVAKAIKAHKDYVMEQTLAASLIHGAKEANHAYTTQQQLDEHTVVISLSKAA
jgi:hypothetical protein